MRMLKFMSWSFWCGFAVNTGIHMAVQDWYGLEGYIEFCREHWIDLHWLVGVTIAVVAGYLYMSRRLRVWTFVMNAETTNEQTD